jgi:hypothetical protein
MPPPQQGRSLHANGGGGATGLDRLKSEELLSEDLESEELLSEVHGSVDELESEEDELDSLSIFKVGSIFG